MPALRHRPREDREGRAASVIDLGGMSPLATALAFAHSAARAACAACDWDPDLAASLEGRRSPVS
jgi:hypothetical protein